MPYRFLWRKIWRKIDDLNGCLRAGKRRPVWLARRVNFAKRVRNFFFSDFNLALNALL
jgi:hypothetical protein